MAVSTVADKLDDEALYEKSDRLGKRIEKRCELERRPLTTKVDVVGQMT